MPKAPLKSRFLIILVFGTLAFQRLYILGKGTLSLVDEKRYVMVHRSWEALLTLDWRTFFQTLMIGTDFRPGYFLTYLLPIALQNMLAKDSSWAYDSSLLVIPQIWNAALSMLALYLFWRLAQKLLGEAPALLALLLYGCLTNSFLYTRHLLGYEASVICTLFALNRTLFRELPSQTKALVTFGAVLVYIESSIQLEPIVSS